MRGRLPWGYGLRMLLVTATIIGAAGLTSAWSAPPATVAEATVSAVPVGDNDSDDNDNDQDHVVRGQVVAIYQDPPRRYPEHSLILGVAGGDVEVVLLRPERMISETGVRRGDHVRVSGEYQTLRDGEDVASKFVTDNLDVTDRFGGDNDND